MLPAQRTSRIAFNGLTTTVFGVGFIGEYILSRLGKIGTQLVIAYRGSGYLESKMRTVGDLGQVYYTHYNMKDEKSLYEAMKYSNVVVNCTGKMQETRNYPFEEIHVEGPRRMARIARECGVQRFIHFSALNANPNPTPHCLKHGSKFLKSKYYGELAVLEEFPDATIIRPADVVGDGDDFINHYTEFMRSRWTHKLPLWDYYDGVVKQPVFVKDLVSGVEKAVTTDMARGKIIQAVGPHRYDFYELIEYIRACGGQGQLYDDCRITNLRWDFGLRALISFVSFTQKYPFCTWERIERDCVTDVVDPNLPTLENLGVKLTPLELQIQILAYYRPREQRVEVEYESAQKIDPPKRLDLLTA